MRFHQKLWLPFIANPFCYVEVAEEKIRIVRYWDELYCANLHVSRSRYTPHKGISSIWGFGKVDIAEKGLHNVEVKNLVRGSKLTYHINQKREEKTQKEIDEKNELEEESNRQRDEERRLVPEGTIFGEKIMIFPYLSGVFHTPLYENHYHKGHGVDLHVKFGDWVNKGDVVFSVKFYSKPDFPTFQFLGKQITIDIKSPVSGLVISRINRDIVRYRSNNDLFHLAQELAILLPELEAHSSKWGDIFDSLANSFFQHRKFLYQDRLTHYQDEQKLRNAFNEEKNKAYKYINFYDYFNIYADYVRCSTGDISGYDYLNTYHFNEYDLTHLIPLLKNLNIPEKWNENH